ncbi:MAG: flagellar hook-basal body complex protein FliE [Planctomycetaceae bacterium]|nr:flagellar hook-basal body complex protein FliE [Planctomycetaceae bacterium]
MALESLGNSTVGGSASGVRPSFSSVGTGKSAGGELPFEELVKGLIQDTSNQQTAVADSVQKLVSGETDSVHDVVLTASKADLAFKLVMEIRNRLIASYQEIMRMQV